MTLPRSMRLAPPPPFVINRATDNKTRDAELSSPPLAKYYKAFACWVVFALLAGYSDLLDFPDNFLPIAAHSIGFGFFLVITTNTTRWLLPVFFAALVFCWVASTIVPPSWYDTVVSVFALGWFLFVLAFVVWGIIPTYASQSWTSSSSTSPGKATSTSNSDVNTPRSDCSTGSDVTDDTTASSTIDSTAAVARSAGTSGTDSDPTLVTMSGLQRQIERLQADLKKLKEHHKNEVQQRRKADANVNKLNDIVKKEQVKNEKIRRELTLSKKIVESRTRDVAKYKDAAAKVTRKLEEHERKESARLLAIEEERQNGIASGSPGKGACKGKNSGGRKKTINGSSASQSNDGNTKESSISGRCSNQEHQEIIERLQEELSYVMSKNQAVHAFLESEDVKMMKHLNNLKQCDWDTICHLEDNHLRHLQAIRLEKTNKATQFLM